MEVYVGQGTTGPGACHAKRCRTHKHATHMSYLSVHANCRPARWEREDLAGRTHQTRPKRVHDLLLTKSGENMKIVLPGHQERARENACYNHVARPYRSPLHATTHEMRDTRHSEASPVGYLDHTVHPGRRPLQPTSHDSANTDTQSHDERQKPTSVDIYSRSMIKR